MYALTLGNFTRYREKPEGSTYRELAGNFTIKEMVLAHSNAGKTPEGLVRRRHLVSFRNVVTPTSANGLTKPEEIVINVTITHTDGVPVVAGGAGTAFEHVNFTTALIDMAKMLVNSATTTASTGLLTSAAIRNGEI